MQYNANYDLMSRTGQLDFKHGKDGMTPFVKPYDPAGNAVRKLLPGSQAPVPTTWMPGYGYVPSDSPVVKQIEQGMEIQQGMLDLEREKLAMERDQMERQTGVGADLREWLAKKLGGAQ